MIKKIYIKGMHCVACEKLLEEEISNVPFVKEVKASLKKNQVEIRYGNREPNTLAIREIVNRLGYSASEKPLDGNNPENSEKTSLIDWALSVLLAVIVILVVRIFQNSGLIPDINSQSASLNNGVSFLIGLVASVSSCLAVVGGVVIAFSQKYKIDSGGFFARALKPNLIFQAGRLAVFFLLGGLLGYLGGEINISGTFVSFYTILIAFILFLLALNILGFVPSITQLGIVMPKTLTLSWSKLKNSNHAAAPFLLGGLSFFLPCGFTQSMQIFALASGSFFLGGAILFFFALGTSPVLLIIGAAASWANSKKIMIFKKAAGILILFFSIYTFGSGWAVRGLKSNIFSTHNSGQPSEDSKKNWQLIAKNGEEQVVRMSVKNTGFSPNVIKIKVGMPVRFIVKGEQLTSCTNRIIIPSLNISREVGSGDTEILFTPEKKGEILFSCWMGMVRGKFIVE